MNKRSREANTDTHEQGKLRSTPTIILEIEKPKQARLRFPHLTRRRICLTGVGAGKTSQFKRSAERGRTNTNQSSCSKADARWDGSKADRPTDTSTWAPELRREMRAGDRHGGCKKS
ncbi:hypothetical protein TIFTF001_014093 [Ficus carica]|uniref:Uncharacterized protein n=1 Tax=Ficus carica TaxID=3494 RepID=A0AA87ZYV7_FICCA|nr:hypothetical protein TIFTF001_014093 [Ficus carica]